ncbi:PEGA domain-containing protein [Oxyplasma meridianum]|uniref:PEGA domain-containing protein n=1 Tax=Oxyplasma meridianum TaxID=3073602 RepID=A0AAX4NIX3_9ARCH
MLIINCKAKAIIVICALIFSGFAVVFSQTDHLLSNRVQSNTSSVSPSVSQNSPIGEYQDGPDAMSGAYNPHNQELYFTDSENNNVTAVNSFLNTSVANISVGTAPMGITYVPYNHDMYVENSNSKNISVIDSTKNTVIATIKLSGSPQFGAYDPQHQTLYVSGQNPGNIGVIWVINVSTNSLVSNFSLPYLNADPQGMAYDPFNGYMYVADLANNIVFAVSSNGSIQALISVGQQPYGVAFDPINRMLYVTDSDSNSEIQGYPQESNVSIINTMTNSVVKNVVPGRLPEGIAYDPADGYIYVSNYLSGNVSVLNPANESIIASLPSIINGQKGSIDMVYDPVLQQMISINEISAQDQTINYNSASGYAAPFIYSGGSPNDIAYDSMNNQIYVADKTNNILVYSINGSMITSISMPSSVLSTLYVRGDNKLFATLTQGAVALINPSTHIVSHIVNLTGACPDGLAYDSINNTLFVASEADNSIDVVSLNTMLQVNQVSVGSQPSALTYSNITNQVYVSQDDANINIINASSYIVTVPYFILGSDPSQAVYDRYSNSIYIANSGNHSLYIINESNINYGNSNTPFTTIPLGSNQTGITIDPSNGLVYVMQPGTDNVTVFNPKLNKTVASISSSSLAGGGYMNYISGGQILLAADSKGYLEAISPSQDYKVNISVGNLIPNTSRWNLQIQPSIDSTLAQVYNSTQTASQSVSLPLPDGTYDLNISSSYTGVSPIHSYFVVNGSTQNMLFYSKYTFSEHGLPSGMKWSVTIGSKEYNSSSNVMGITFSREGLYVANISGPRNYQAYPSSLTVRVDRTNTSYNIFFQSQENQTFGAITKTIGEYDNTSYNGDSYIPVSYRNSSFYSAYDPSNGLLFTPVNSSSSNSSINVYNISSGSLIKTNYTPMCGLPFSTYYDPINSLVYVTFLSSNYIASFYPSNLTLDKKVELKGELGPAMTSIGNYIYVANSTGTVFGINTLTDQVTNYSVSGFLPSPIAMVHYGSNLIMLNYSGKSLIELNLSTKSANNLAFPSGFMSLQIISGKPGTLYISSNDTDYVEIFNESSDAFTGSIHLNGTAGGNIFSGNNATGGVYDPLNGYMYFSSGSSGSFLNINNHGNFTVVNPSNNSVVSSFPGLNSSSDFSMFLVPKTQKIYSVSLMGDIISVISPQKYYNMTINEIGLPAGTTWKIILSNGKTYTSSGTMIEFLAENNTLYTYTLISGNSSYEGTPGSFILSGGPTQSQAIFSLPTYKVTFTESGLPSGTTWYVNSSTMSEHSLAPSNVSFNLANGTYSFTVTNLSTYYTVTDHFKVTVDGKNVTETVKYYHWAYIVGTISPTNATLTVNGNAIQVSSSGSFNVSVANGTYSVVASLSGYHTYYSNFSLKQGSVKNLTINLKQNSHPSAISLVEIYVIIVAIVAIAVIAALLIFKRRK